MSARFSRLPSDDADRGRYYPNRESLDLTESVSYDDFRRKPISESVTSLIDRDGLDAEANVPEEKENNSAPLRQSLRQYSTLVWWLLAISLPILYSGFDSGIVGGANGVKAFQRDFGDCCTYNELKKEDESIVPAFWLGIWDAVGPLGQIAGGLVGAWFMDKWGRKFCLKIGSIIGICAIGIFLLSNTPPNKNIKRGLILAGKMLQGFGLGALKLEAYTYMSEITPVSLKGAVMSIVPMFTLLGQLIGGIAIFLISDSEQSSSYLFAIGSQLIVALPPFIIAFFLPESPAFLLKTKQDAEGALKSFERLLGPKNNAKAAMLKLQKTLDEEAKKSKNLSYMDCFNAANIRRTLIVMFAGTIENLFGLPLVSQATLFLQKVGMSNKISAVFLIGGIVVGVVANTASTWTVTHIGRRKLTVTTLLIASGLWAVVGFAGIKKLSFTPWLTGGIFIAIVVVCGLGCWPASYAIMGETSSIRLRAHTQALGNISKNVIEITLNFSLPYLYNPDAANLGGKTGFLFTILAGLGGLLTYLFVPELKNRSAIEIDHLFANGVRSIGSTNWRDAQLEEIPLRGA